MLVLKKESRQTQWKDLFVVEKVWSY